MLKIKKLLILFAIIAALLVPVSAWADDTGIEVSTDAVFKIAVTGISGDITLTDSFSLSDVVEISANVKIIGGGYTITAAKGKRHFTLSETGNKEFQNLTLKGNSGGGVDIAGTGAVNFTNVIFDGNTGTNGAVNINAAATVTFDGANFTSNGTTSTTAGAVYVNNSGAAVSFTGITQFTGNKAANGGAIYAPNGGNIIFNGAATFTSNTAATSGGAINSAGTLSFASTAAFTSNTATAGDGGAINSTGSVSFASTATFKSNKATAGSGGAVYSTGSLVFTGAATFGTSTTDGNTAGTDGGAIYASAWPTFSSTASFTGNTATSAGGAAYISGTTAFTLSDSYTFTSNTAGTNGGAVYAAGALTISGGTFTTNTASANGGAAATAGTLEVTSGDFTIGSNAAANGGALASSGASINISGGSFNGQTAATVNATLGGAIYASNASSVMAISGGTFTYNTASKSGGAVYSAGTVNITGGDFTTVNTANGTTPGSDGGGAVYADKITITGTNASPIEFKSQTASAASGGAIYAATSLEATQTIFEDNTAYSGGAVYVLGKLNLSNVSFVGNKTTGADGGAVYSLAPANTLANCYFKENLSVHDGGAIAVALSTADFNISYSYFYNNTAGSSTVNAHDYGGGAAYLYVKTAEIKSCTFNANKVVYGDSACGGALSLANTSDASIQNCTFYGNISQNSSEHDGGAVYLNGTGTTTLSFCTMTGNQAIGTSDNIHGGALYVNNGTLNIIGSLIAGNDYGGDIYKGNGNIASAGYNRIGRFTISTGYTNWDSSNAGRNVTNDIADNGGSRGWGFENFFSDKELSANGGQTAGAGNSSSYSCVVPTLELDESDPTSTKAVDGARNLSTNVVIPNGSYPPLDQRDISRTSGAGAAPDIGAFETSQNADDSDSKYASYTISSIKLSGIPNTLSIVGQTAILHATVTYLNGDTTTTEEPLTWTLKDIEGSNAIRFSDNKNSKTSSTGSVYADGIGVSEITVSARNGAYSDSKKIYVIWNQQDTNIHPNVLNLVNQLNLQLSNDSINFYIMSAGYENAVSDSSFKSAFKNAWGTEPKVIELNGSSFSSNANFSRAAQSKLDKAYAAGITANINNQETGAVLPVFCIWNFALDDLDEDFNSNGDAIETMTDSEFSAWLFKNLNIGFEITGGEFLPAVSSSNQSSLQSAAIKDLVTAEDAVNSGALSVQRGENDVTVSMLAYIANVEPQGSTGSKLLTTSSNQKLLVIPGGNSAKNISGTIWTAEAASSSNNNNSNSGSSSGKKSGGGGGGGCDALGLNLIALILLALLFNRKHA